MIALSGCAWLPDRLNLPMWVSSVTVDHCWPLWPVRGLAGSHALHRAPVRTPLQPRAQRPPSHRLRKRSLSIEQQRALPSCAARHADSGVSSATLSGAQSVSLTHNSVLRPCERLRRSGCIEKQVKCLEFVCEEEAVCAQHCTVRVKLCAVPALTTSSK
jgi:hypothetical protein